MRENSDMVCSIEHASAAMKVCIRGFAFSKEITYNNLSTTQVVLEGENEVVYADAMRLYNPTIAAQIESEKNLNFVEFYTSFSRTKLSEEKYRIGVCSSLCCFV